MRQISHIRALQSLTHFNNIFQYIYKDIFAKRIVYIYKNKNDKKHIHHLLLVEHERWYFEKSIFVFTLKVNGVQSSLDTSVLENVFFCAPHCLNGFWSTWFEFLGELSFIRCIDTVACVCISISKASFSLCQMLRDSKWQDDPRSSTCDHITFKLSLSDTTVITQTSKCAVHKNKRTDTCNSEEPGSRAS